MTQIAYDVEALNAWADLMRARGLFERAKVIVGVVPLRSAKAARFMHERLPGVRVPGFMIEDLERAGDDAAEVGIGHTIDVVQGIRGIADVAGVHLMGMGRDDAVARVVEGAGLFPRPTGVASADGLGAVLDRRVRPVARADVHRGRPDHLVVRVLLPDVRGPTGHARAAKIGVIRSVGIPSTWYTLAA